jgi:hypothetical protein
VPEFDPVKWRTPACDDRCRIRYEPADEDRLSDGVVHEHDNRYVALTFGDRSVVDVQENPGMLDLYLRQIARALHGTDGG